MNLLACAGPALGDGGMFIRQHDRVDVLQPTQKVYIRWDGSQEKLLIQTKYEGPAEEMVWIVPVPSEPEVEIADGGVFDELSEETDWPDIAHADLGGFWISNHGFDVPFMFSASFGGASPVEWHRRIGDYDVVLLKPVGEETIISWLNNNGYAVPDKAIPVLEDYLREQWWMVAAKIHPDALTNITRENLAQGLLHPLEMTFQSHSCLYPMRLTSIAAGPVEELIYIEGPTHYEPLTFADDKWTIDIFGGPVRQVPEYRYLSDIEAAIETLEGRSETGATRHLTKLRRVFLPEEMTQDIIFTKLDYSKWLKSEDRAQVGEAATQYGRHRDPNGVVPLLDLLSSGILEQAEPAWYQEWPSRSARILSRDSYVQWTAYTSTHRQDGSERLSPFGDHIFSVIWALGEIGIEHKIGSEVEDSLLRCAGHNNQLVRMKAYIALMKLQSQRLGPVLTERLAYVPSQGPPSASWDSYLVTLADEMDIVADWISRFGTTGEKDSLVKALTEPIRNLQGPMRNSNIGSQVTAPTKSDWFEWIVWRAACTRDARLVVLLQDLYARLAAIDGTSSALPFVQRAQAACGSADAINTVVRQVGDGEAGFFADANVPTTEKMASLESFYPSGYYPGAPGSLRVQVLQKRQVRYELYPMPSDASDEVLRLALSEKELSDWYALYLLCEIKSPRAEDRDRLMQIWGNSDLWMRLIATDVLYSWGDRQTLMSLYETGEPNEVKSEVAWALADLGVAEAATMVEEQIRGSWNPDWVASNRTFILEQLEEIAIHDSKAIDTVRKGAAVWKYFHPRWEGLYLHPERDGLDDGRLAVLKGLAGDSSIHPGLKFELLAIDYAAKDWAKPLLTSAIKDLLEAHPDSSAVNILVSRIDAQLVVDACGASDSDEFRRSLMVNLLAGGSIYNLPVIEGLLWEVWVQRYRETQGQSILFREPGDLAASVDYYCQHAQWVTRGRDSHTYASRPTEPMLQSIVNDDSLPAGYRAFLLVYWPTAPSYISKESVENLLNEDMPDFIRDALSRRLLDWQ